MLGMCCLRQRDIKVLIAYSSVVHIALVLVGVVRGGAWGFMGAVAVMVAHGLCSSGLFAWANRSYEHSHSRSLMLNKGGLIALPRIRI